MVEVSAGDGENGLRFGVTEEEEMPDDTFHYRRQVRAGN